MSLQNKCNSHIGHAVAKAAKENGSLVRYCFYTSLLVAFPAVLTPITSNFSLLHFLITLALHTPNISFVNQFIPQNITSEFGLEISMRVTPALLWAELHGIISSVIGLI